MKTKITTLLCCMLFSIATFAATETKTRIVIKTETKTFTVYGNCSMCKARIEGALKKKEGVISKNWNKDTKVITVTYDPAKITVQQIAEKIAAAGHDNEFATTKDNAYKNLHECCQYDRPKQNK